MKIRRRLGKWLIRLGNRLAPPTMVKVHLTADTAAFRDAVEETIRRMRHAEQVR